MSRVTLTKRAIDALKPDPEGDVYLWDDLVRGLGVRCFPSGRKTFVLRYGSKRRRRWYSLGDYGPLTLKAAREDATGKLGSVIAGADPVADREKRAAMPTFAEWAAEYLIESGQRKKPRNDDKTYLRRATEAWGRRSLDSITADDVARVFRAQASRRRIAANRWLASVRACFAAAWRRDLISTNPAARVRPNPENPPRARVLSGDELRRILDALDVWPDPFERAAFVLLLETGARLSEVLSARWADIDLSGGLKTWRLPSPKAGHPQIVPLAPSTVAMLEALPRLGTMVIPGRHDPNARRFDLKGPWAELRRVAALPDDVHVHDIRRTFGLRVAREAGLHVASKLLRHADVRITEKVYAPLGMAELATAAAAQALAMEAQRRAAEERAKREATEPEAATAIQPAVNEGDARVLPMRRRGV